MATNAELKIVQKTALYDLLTLKTDMEEADKAGSLVLLNKLINKTKAVMDSEDVAYVEKMLSELK